MTERSHGKLRPSLPRAKGLPRVLTAPDRPAERGPDGRFLPGNKAASEQAALALFRRWLGRGASSAQVEQALREARTCFRAELRDMPSDAPVVQRLVAAATRDATLSAHLALRAVELGIESDQGRRLLELSMKLSARAERQTVTALDVAHRVGARRGAATDAETWAALLAGDPEEPPPAGEDGAGRGAPIETTASTPEPEGASTGQPGAENEEPPR